MAYSLRQLRDDATFTSIHGRRLGLDSDGNLVGLTDIRTAVENIQTTETSSLAPYGLTLLLTTGSSQNGSVTLQAPRPGNEKRIFLQSTTTGCQFVKASGSALFYGASVSTVGSTVLNFLGAGANVILRAASSIAWVLMGIQSSLVSSDSSKISFTTST